MDEEEIEKAVVAYLKKKGFKQTELAFQEEQQHNKNNSSSIHSANSQIDSDITKKILSLSELETGPERCQEEYSKLRSWAYSSLDLYKHELLRVLYPVFIHCFMELVARGHNQEARAFFNSYREDHEMTHLRDLQKLEGVLSPSHLEEMEFAHSIRLSKVNIKMCQYSYDLLLQYLHKTESITMLGIINERINFQEQMPIIASTEERQGKEKRTNSKSTPFCQIIVCFVPLMTINDLYPLKPQHMTRVSPGQPGSISDDAEVVTLVASGHDASLINQKEVRWGLLEDSLEERLEKTGGSVPDSEKFDGDPKEGEVEENKKKSVECGKQGASLKKLKKDKVGVATAKSSRTEGSTVTTAPRVKPELALPAIPTEVEHSILEDLRNRVQLSNAALPSVSFYTFVNTHNGLNCASISHDGSLVASGFSDSSLKVWDMAKLGQQTGPFRLWSTKLNANLVCYKGHNYPVWDVQFSPVGHYFASSSHDRTARIWSMDRIQPLRIMAGHLSDVDCVQWHANCNYIATGSSDKTVRLWDVQTGDCVRIFIGHRSMILSLAMSPDGRYMASGDEDGTVMMWDLSSGRCITPLVGHSSCVWSLAFSGEGSLLASGSADCTIKLWDVTTSAKAPLKEENKSGSNNRLRSLKTLPTKATPVYALHVRIIMIVSFCGFIMGSSKSCMFYSGQFSRRNLLFAAGAFSKSA
ncbi:hypothetical protein RND71_005888 [Anisodus tanguticus]|uniref:TFIID subunit TAF5 NTD2 domain-containing protein n=1 Tax=Anisodus tanguticus TaxID=243964 RepID=A0AAE1ST14_9SOLA|nr:hypothetical protein RND71_005888 [Anisodus tanguticus]